MANFEMTLPTDIMNDIRKIEANADAIFGKMTKAAAEATASNIRANAPTQELKNSITVSKTYKTPSDDGINNKVMVTGYQNGGGYAFTRRGRATNSTKYTTYKGKPMEFIAKVLEYGTSPRWTDKGAYRGYVGKKPFFRKGFKPEQITQIMKRVQLEASGGLLSDDE